ncbi:hypothetical protein Leryth_006871 [Lithospermum erythrorhizon]|nr:hypothetical protein Leryth_006871 [Lithospermum erythrorhizon]
MAENKGEPTKNIQHQHLSTSNKDTQQDQESSEPGSFISSTPLFISTCPPSSQQFIETVNPKRQKYTPGQWKLLPSPSPQQQQQSIQMNILSKDSSTPSPSRHPTTNPPLTASSSDTAASTPPHDSPRPSQSPASTGQELAIATTPKIEGEKLLHQLSRKGKFVSPVWKPNEMLWLARGWRAQYQGGFVSPTHEGIGEGGTTTSGSGRGKTRADKDREVSEFLNKHGIQRDAKTAGTKWDNMLGEFRKVYEYERGGEREQYGKSYFRLSPYDRKIRRLPASFDEEVFDELCQFMGPRMRGSSSQGGRIGGGTSSSALITSTPPGDGDESPSAFMATARTLPPPPIFKEDEYPYPARGKQLATLGFEGTSSIDIGGGRPSALISSPKDLHRIGKIRMIWEESVNLWAEEGEFQRGRIKHEGLSFLNADEIAFFDDSMVSCTMETFEDGPYKGFSVDRFVLGQQVKVIGRRKSSSPLTPPTSGGSIIERVSLAPLPEASIRTISQLDYQDPGDYYLRCLRVPPSTLPTLFELSWHLQEPPPEDFRFPLRRDVYKDLPQGKELFFTPSYSELLDSRSIIYDIIAPIIRTNPSLTASTATSRDSFISIWDDSINRVVSKFCSNEVVFVRKPGSELSSSFQDQWPHLTGFLKGFCLWRGEETDHIREAVIDPASSIVEKILWSYMDLPYILGYYAVGYIVTVLKPIRKMQKPELLGTG